MLSSIVVYTSVMLGFIYQLAFFHFIVELRVKCVSRLLHKCLLAVNSDGYSVTWNTDCKDSASQIIGDVPQPHLVNY